MSDDLTECIEDDRDVLREAIQVNDDALGGDAA